MISNNNYIHPLSLTQQVLTNKTFLNLICPSNCMENRIHQTGDSIIEALIHSPKDPFANELKGNIHWVTKPVKALFRMTAVFAVGLTVSPCGIIYHGVKTVKQLYHYHQEIDPARKNEEWEKTRHLANAFFQDGLCFVVTGILLFSLVVTSINVPVSAEELFLFYPYMEIHEIALSTFNIAYMSFAFTVSLYMSLIPRHTSEMFNNGPLTLSLEMRNQLGLVDQDGNLLRFSQRDAFQYDKVGDKLYLFKGEAYQSFSRFIRNSELDLLDLAIEANAMLKENQLPPLEFSYPLNGKKIARQLENAFKNREYPPSSELAVPNDPVVRVPRLAAELKKTQFKVEILHHLFYEMKYQSVPNRQCIKKLTCLIPERSYKQYFEKGVPGLNRGRMPDNDPASAFENSIHDFYRGIALEPLDPTTQSRPQASQTYQCFLYDLRINKWKIENNQTPASYQELLGLTGRFSYIEMREAFRKYSLALHPDRNLSNPVEAGKLFQAFNTIMGRIEEINRQA